MRKTNEWAGFSLVFFLLYVTVSKILGTLSLEGIFGHIIGQLAGIFICEVLIAPVLNVLSKGNVKRKIQAIHRVLNSTHFIIATVNKDTIKVDSVISVAHADCVASLIRQSIEQEEAVAQVEQLLKDGEVG